MCYEGKACKSLDDTADSGMKDRKNRNLRKSAVFLSLGAEVAGMAGGGAILGYLVDSWLGTPPVFILLGVLGSLLGIFWRIKQILSWLEKADSNIDNDQ